MALLLARSQIRNRGRTVFNLFRTLSTNGRSDSRFNKFIDRRCSGSIKFDKYALNRAVPAEQLEYRDVLPMWVADMDFEVPECITDALVARTRHKIYGYTGPDFAVKSAIRSYLSRAHQQNDVSDVQIVFLPGLVVALNIIGRVFAAKGQSVMTSTPIYPPFMSSAKNAGATSRGVPLQQVDGRYTFDFPAMESEIICAEEEGDPVGVFLLCNPHNPVGRVFEHDELLELVAFCKRHNIAIVSDEIHCELVLPTKNTEDKRHHISLLSLDPGDKWIAKNSITLHAPSKTLNIAGLCASFAVIPSPSLRGSFKRASSGIMADLSPFGYAALRAAYEDAHVEEIAAFSENLTNHIRSNLDMVSAWAETTSGMVEFQHEHQATYLVWLDCRRLQSQLAGDKPNMAQWLETHAGLGLNDGITFGGHRYDGFVRMNLGCTHATLAQALERFSRAIAAVVKN